MDTGEAIKKQIMEHMRRRGVSQADLAERLGKSRQTVSTTLLHRRGVSQGLSEILDTLGLELTVQPKATERKEKPPVWQSFAGLLDDPAFITTEPGELEHALGEAISQEVEESALGKR